jgi:hypothetical protein
MYLKIIAVTLIVGSLLGCISEKGPYKPTLNREDFSRVGVSDAKHALQ